jgi:hypothetical protein
MYICLIDPDLLTVLSLLSKVATSKVDRWGKGLFRRFEDFEFHAGFFCLLWIVPA